MSEQFISTSLGLRAVPIFQLEATVSVLEGNEVLPTLLVLCTAKVDSKM